MVSLGDGSLLVAPAAYVEANGRDFQLSELDSLVQDHTFGPLASDPLGTRVCVLTDGRDATRARV